MTSNSSSSNHLISIKYQIRPLMPLIHKVKLWGRLSEDLWLDHLSLKGIHCHSHWVQLQVTIIQDTRIWTLLKSILFNSKLSWETMIWPTLTLNTWDTSILWARNTIIWKLIQVVSCRLELHNEKVWNQRQIWDMQINMVILQSHTWCQEISSFMRLLLCSKKKQRKSWLKRLD